ncbi:MAG: hypothetical protein NT157_06805 [Candidatus Micrarchaeota archaeon]|nr:hypothetical protein [Candidatus Micrarchaeota archaeon]
MFGFRRVKLIYLIIIQIVLEVILQILTHLPSDEAILSSESLVSFLYLLVISLMTLLLAALLLNVARIAVHLYDAKKPLYWKLLWCSAILIGLIFDVVSPFKFSMFNGTLLVFVLFYLLHVRRKGKKSRLTRNHSKSEDEPPRFGGKR